MIIEEVKKELTGHIIPFWNKLRDDENGGFYGFMSYDLKLISRLIRALSSTQEYFGSIQKRISLWAIRHFLTTHATLTSLSKTTASTMSTAEFIG